MTIEYTFSLAQLAQILSALENERRNPWELLLRVFRRIALFA